METNRKEQLGEAFRFCIVGGIATLLHYALYWILKFWIDFNAAYAIGYGISFVLNYFLTSYFTFKKDASVKSGIGFSGAHLFNLLFQMLLLNIFTWLGVSNSLAPIPVYAIAIPVNFLMVRYVFTHLSKKSPHS